MFTIPILAFTMTDPGVHVALTWCSRSTDPGVQLGPQRARLCTLLEWAERRNAIITGPTKTPTLGVKGRAQYRLFSFYLDGSVYWAAKESAYADGRGERDRLAADLRQLGLIDPGVDLANIVDGRNLSRKLGNFSEEQFSRFLAVLDSVIPAPIAPGNPIRQ